MTYEFNSLGRKYTVLTGIPYNPNSWVSITEINRNTIKVSLGEYVPSKSLTPILNWCEEHFADNWIHSLQDFYFKNQEDATLFALKWL